MAQRSESSIIQAAAAESEVFQQTVTARVTLLFVSYCDLFLLKITSKSCWMSIAQFLELLSRMLIYFTSGEGLKR